MNDDSVALMQFAMETIDDGAAQSGPGRVFVSIRFVLTKPFRTITRLERLRVYSELAAFYPKIGRPPVLRIRMLVVGYVFAIRSERALCREVQVNLAYRRFCGLSIQDPGPLGILACP
jgi:hypothetical protein